MSRSRMNLIMNTKLCLLLLAAASARARGVLEVANEKIEITAHDHFGIPAGLTATITETGSEPLVLLDAVLRPADRRFHLQ